MHSDFREPTESLVVDIKSLTLLSLFPTLFERALSFLAGSLRSDHFLRLLSSWIFLLSGQ